jgi:hypothetical protein
VNGAGVNGCAAAAAVTAACLVFLERFERLPTPPVTLCVQLYILLAVWQQADEVSHQVT